ncbi:MAG: DUF2892 domain-containing protein [Rhodomicrobium sp.]
MLNVGFFDRTLRFVLGVALIAVAYYQPVTGISWFDRNEWLGWIGVIPILTAVGGWCPLYSVLGICTTRSEAQA